MARRMTAIALRFCHEYPVDYDPTKAAVRAGYSPSGARGNGGRLLRRADVRQKINEIEQAMTPELNAGYVKTKLYLTIEHTKTDQVRVNALRELAKVLHLYEEEGIAPDTINLILRRGRNASDRPGDPAEAVAAPATRGKRSS